MAKSLILLAVMLSLSTAAAQSIDRQPSAHLLRAQQTELLLQVAAGTAVALPRTGDVEGRLGVPAIDSLLQEYDAAEVRRLIPPRRIPRPAAFQKRGLDRYYMVRLREPREDLGAVAARFEQLETVSLARSQQIYWAANTPNDPQFPNQWNLQDDRIKAENGWDVRTDASSILVGVSDTGIDLDHPDLINRKWRNPGEIASNGIDDDGNGYVDDRAGYDFANNDGRPDDDNGHGTHVAGILGAEGNNGTAIAGVCWNATIVGLKSLDSLGGGLAAWIAESVVYAADNGIRVLNLSLAAPFDEVVLRNAINYSADLDVLNVAAAGNFGTTTVNYPAGYAKCMAIISSDRQDTKGNNSSYGSWCDMAAPGVQITSLWNDGGIRTQGGTSAACPHVAGAAALVRVQNPDLHRKLVRQVLRYSSKDLGSPGFDILFGWGRLNLSGALKRAGSLRGDRRSMTADETLQLQLSHPDAAHHLYLLVASRFGRSPGWPLSNLDPTDARVFPLNYDPIGTWPLNAPGNGVFINFFGQLDARGEVLSWFRSGNLFAGETLDFAFLTWDPANLTRPKRISNVHEISVQ